MRMPNRYLEGAYLNFELFELLGLGSRLSSKVKMAEKEQFVAEFHGVRHKKQEGVLLLTSARVAWSSGSVFQINYPYNQIRGSRKAVSSSYLISHDCIYPNGFLT